MGTANSSRYSALNKAEYTLLRECYNPNSSAIFSSTSLLTFASIIDDRSSFGLSASFSIFDGVPAFWIIPFALK